MALLHVHPDDMDSYRLFIKAKSLPAYRVRGRTIHVPDEYANLLGRPSGNGRHVESEPHHDAFDYQRDISALAVRKRKFAVFADCGLGKTLIFFDWCRHVSRVMPDRKVLIISPLMVVSQTLLESTRFYRGDLPIKQVPSNALDAWLNTEGGGIGITNYEALKPEVRQGRLGALVVDESSMLKSHYGKWGREIIRLGKGLDWKLALTGTPAPNDRVEYANHAVLLDQFPTVNAFLARYFVNKGQTQERWVLKPHALEPFYRSLSHWCIFLTNPATYGWRDNARDIPPIHVHIHHVPLTGEQEDAALSSSGQLFATEVGGITTRAMAGSIAKGVFRGKRIATHKPSFIRDLVDSWPEESTIIWCIYNGEQDLIEEQFPEAACIRGETPFDVREELIADFKTGRRRVLISKPKILGFGLNLQIATRQIFSGLQDSYESYYQAVKRSNRIGSTRPLNVHIPVTELEEPMVANVLRKAGRVQADTEEQERIFHAARI